MKGKKARIVYYVILGILVFYFLIYPFSKFFKIKNDSYIQDHTVPSDYSSLFVTRDTAVLKKITSYSTKYRFPICLFDYKSKYALIVYKISDSINNPLSKEITVRKSYSRNYSSEVYTIVNEKYFELKYNDDTIRKITHIELNLSGDSITNQVQNDSLVLYYLLFHQISWTKNPNTSLDIYIEPIGFTAFSNRIPASIAFIKRNNSLYFVLLSVGDESSSIDRTILPGLLLHDSL